MALRAVNWYLRVNRSHISRLTRYVIPWCRFEAPSKVIHQSFTDNRSPAIFFCLDTTMPFTFRQGDLSKLDLQVDRGSDFTAWKAQWDSYASLSGLNGEDRGVRNVAVISYAWPVIPV